MTSLTLARHAMATRFELVLHGARAETLRAAGEEALDEIGRIEGALSLFRSDSEIANVNARAALQPVKVTPGTFRLLELSLELARLTEGGFDITVGPLVRLWGFHGEKGAVPSAAELARARACVGTDLIQLDPAERTVRFARPGVMIDLGAIGKGWAIERAAEILLEAGIERALLHGGTSTAQAIGAPPDAPGWRLAIGAPPDWFAPRAEPEGSPPPAPTSTNLMRLFAGQQSSESASLTTLVLRDQAISVSAIWGKAFAAGHDLFGHILDPRTGSPVHHAVLAAVALPSAAETDALSTALMAQGPTALAALAAARPGGSALAVTGRPGRFELRTHGPVWGQS